VPLSLAPEDRRIGDYRVLGHWSTGQVSHVYLARKLGEPEAGRLFALKVPRPQFALYAADQPAYRPGALGRPPHPNTLATREVLDQNGRLYMVTDFAHGETLESALLARQGATWPVATALQVALHITRALEFLHGRTPLHGEVCPSNVTVGYDGVARLFDSGLSGREQRPVQARYLSPEQAAELSDLDARVDVHGVGLILWELLTGQPALQGSSPTELRAAVLSGAVQPPSARGAVCDPSVDELVMTALSVERGQRHPSAAALAEALEAELLRLDPGAGPHLVSALMEATFPAHVDRLERLLALWTAPPNPSALTRPDGPLAAIKEALAHRRRPAPERGVELDATLQALAHSLPPLSPEYPGVGAQPEDGWRGGPGAESDEFAELEPSGPSDTSFPSASEAAFRAPDPAPARRRVLLLAAAALAALGVGAGVLLTRPPEPLPQGRLRITTRPPGAEVLIDGEAMGTTPITIPGLTAGPEHRVQLTLPGHTGVERAVRLEGGQTRSLSLDLVPTEPADVPEPPPGDGDEAFKDNPY
jgi:hypothetical protein